MMDDREQRNIATMTAGELFDYLAEHGPIELEDGSVLETFSGPLFTSGPPVRLKHLEESP